MDQKPINPLFKHFRRPALHLKLPSNGQNWAENSLELPVTGEIPVYPMTSADEITLKTPDALLNGSGIVQVIQSCCPNIVDAWKMPSTDVDAVLMAIRIASYGPTMTVASTCPKCSIDHEYDINLSSLISEVSYPNYSIPVEFDGLKIYLQPQQYFSVTKTNLVQYEEQRIIQALNNNTLDEDVKNTQIKTSMQKLLDLNNKLIVDSTKYIETEDGSKVRDPVYIAEFYSNAEGRVTKLIEKRLTEIAAEAALPLTKLTCTDCNTGFEIPLEFDYARFFAQGS
jgi:hypothetical protein